jgi:hypothetical protein
MSAARRRELGTAVKDLRVALKDETERLQVIDRLREKSARWLRGAVLIRTGPGCR